MPKTTVLQPNQTQFFSSKRLFISKIIVPITSTAVAVMFTFSFGSAFAVTKADYNETLAKTYFDSVMKTVKESASGTITLKGNGETYEVGYTVLEANYAAIFDAATDFVKANANEPYIGNGANASYEVNRLEYVLNDVADNQELKMTLVAAQYAADKQEAIDVLNGLDLSDYSTADLTDALKKALDDKCTTYVDHIKHLISDAVDEINKATFTSDSEVDAYATAKAKIDEYFYDADTVGTKDNTKVLAVEKYYEGQNGAKVGLGIYELNEDYQVAGTTLASFTTTAVAGADAVDAAKVAAWKASTAQKYAAYLNTKDADKTYAANVKKVFDFLAENGINPTGWDGFFARDAAKTYAKKFATAIANVEQFEADAARYAAETDVNGVLVRDAKDVADLVIEGTMNEYLATTGIGPETAKNYKTIDQALVAIYSLYASLDDELLAFEKKVRETAVADFLEDAEADKTYYPAELAKVKELTEEYLAKVNAITDVDKILKDKDGYDATYRTKINGVKTAKEVDQTSYSTLEQAAIQYAGILNGQLKGNNKYYLGEENEKIKSEINKLVGNAGARTTKDINALSSEAIALVTNLPTVGAVEAAKDAADNAVKALPRTVKVGDKALVDAAIAAVDAYEELSASTYGGNAVANAVVQYAYAVNNELAAKVKAVDKTDKAALKALKDEIKTFVDTYEDYAAKDAVANVFKANKDKLQGYLDDIQKDAAAAVTKAIAAIPVKANLTEAHKATVEAARKAYDAYVAEYTNYYKPYVSAGNTTDGFVADDFNYTSLFNAETQLGLNAPDPALAVKALKLTARSTAKKGSITVKWTVKGDASAADGYQVWKSTKQSKGYKKAITTAKKSYKNTKGLKKGTRYYYKVRAYKVVDGKNIYSDWSNKAYRVAK